MKFQISAVILDVREFIETIRPVLKQQLGLNNHFYLEEWIMKKLLDDMLACHIDNFLRRDSRYEQHYYALRHHCPNMEQEFYRALREILPLHLFPNSVQVKHLPNGLLIRKLDSSHWQL